MLTLILGALIAAGAAPAEQPPASDVAVIDKSASTNRAGLSISVTRAGEAIIRTGSAIRSTTVERTLANRLYADIDRAGNLDQLPSGHCMKSASFGTTTSITYRGRRSPDLQCAENPAERALNADATSIFGMAMRTAPVAPRQPPVLIGPASPH